MKNFPHPFKIGFSLKATLYGIVLLYGFSSLNPSLSLATQEMDPFISFQMPEKALQDSSISNEQTIPSDPTTYFLGQQPLIQSGAMDEEPNIPSIFSDPSAPAMTPIPPASSGRPEWVSFSRNDFSSTDVTQISPSNTSLNFKLWNIHSFGGVFVSYDDPATDDGNAATTADVETINLLTAFPNGIVLGLDNGGSNIQEILLEVQDATGKRSSVKMAGIEAVSKRWKILAAQFAEVDLTKIQTLAIIATGEHPNGQLSIYWGDVKYVPPVFADGNNPAVTSLPPLSHKKTEWTGFARNDYSSTDIVQLSPTLTSLNFKLWNSHSYGGIFLNYDIPSTASDTETIDLNTFFPDGIVLGLDNQGTSIQEVLLELQDRTGKRDIVKLSGIEAVSQRWKILLSQFDEVDVTKIQTVALIATGQHPNGKLNVNWGNFSHEQILGGRGYAESQITMLNESPNVFASGGNFLGGLSGDVFFNQISSHEFEYQYGLWNADSSYVAVDIQKGSFQSNGSFQGTALTLPEKLVIAARGGESGFVRVVITDTQHREVVFLLNLESSYQNFELALTGSHIPHGFDPSQIARIRFLQERRGLNQEAWADVIKVKIKGLNFEPLFLPAEHLALKTDLIEKGLSYFDLGGGIDPVTHLPYDRRNADGTLDPTHKITQPTLTGFYLQMLGDFIRGKIDWAGKTRQQALEEIDHVLESLSQIQSQYGWKGLIPWIDQGQPYPIVGIGDNANLAQSLAVMIGALELANLNPVERQQAQAIAIKAELFMDRQSEGYLAAVDPTFGIFAGAINRSTGVPTSFLDRLMTEFRGAIAFLLIRYPNLPDSVWDHLVVHKDSDYISQERIRIDNVQSYEGGAFQYFWPLLRNNERDFLGFRNVLENYYITQTDYASSHQIPGFLSASDVPDNLYHGLNGIPQIAETQDPVLSDLGTAYALASGFSVNQYLTLDWLLQISKQLPATYGQFGFLDSARSNNDVAQFYLGIDVASTILALTNAGPEAFEHYLRNRNQEQSYNLLYDRASQLGVSRTWAAPKFAPTFPDKSFSVFSHVEIDGTLGSFPYSDTTVAGARFFYNGFGTPFDGRFWELDQTYDARENRLEIFYSVKNSPKKIKLELKDDSVPDQLLYSTELTLADDNTPFQKIDLILPNDPKLANVRKVLILIDQGTGDSFGDFFVHYLNFRYFESS